MKIVIDRKRLLGFRLIGEAGRSSKIGGKEGAKAGVKNIDADPAS